MKAGLLPPIGGTFNNDCKDSCGAFMRSQIWACIAPSCPEVAGRFAFEDAIIDHGSGEEMSAEVFCAALQSAAFVESDVGRLIDIGLSYIPDDCGVVNAVRNARKSHSPGASWSEARDAILAEYRGRAHKGRISREVLEKGFEDGTREWDAPSNIGMLMIGLLYGEGDSERSLCTTVRLAVELTLEGWPMVMLVPNVLVSGNLQDSTAASGAEGRTGP